VKTYVFDTLDYYGDEPPIARLNACEKLAEFSEGLGYDGIIISEHHFSPSAILTSPLLFLLHLSRKVNFQVGVFVLPLPYYDPRRLAEDLVTLDNFTSGRLIAALGSGFNVNEFKGFGIDINKRRQIASESKLIVKTLVAGKKISKLSLEHFSGEEIQITCGSFYGISDRLYTAATGLVTAKYVAEQSENLVLSPFEGGYAGFDELGVCLEDYWRRNDSEHSDVIVTLFVFCAETSEKVEAASFYFNRYIIDFRRGAQKGDDLFKLFFYRGQALFGTPKELIEKLSKLNRFKIKKLALIFNFGGMPEVMYQKSMHLFKKMVLSELDF
jgi:alkanesulfonate monooxygenase SsuD/methylene tetrahydromethanopterin reductase-like flavin-dependent oxidoreductase (luciferase family)